jgi:hypothetical protein
MGARLKLQGVLVPGEMIVQPAAHHMVLMVRDGTARNCNRLLGRDPAARRMRWRRMVRHAQVYVRGAVRHRDHKIIYLDGWHRVYMNRERFARHARQIAFLD